jgi:hypothetical protein
MKLKNNLMNNKLRNIGLEDYSYIKVRICSLKMNHNLIQLQNISNL